MVQVAAASDASVAFLLNIIRDPETGEDICTSTRNDPIECLRETSP